MNPKNQCVQVFFRSPVGTAQPSLGRKPWERISKINLSKCFAEDPEGRHNLSPLIS